MKLKINKISNNFKNLNKKELIFLIHLIEEIHKESIESILNKKIDSSEYENIQSIDICSLSNKIADSSCIKYLIDVVEFDNYTIYQYKNTSVITFK